MSGDTVPPPLRRKERCPHCGSVPRPVWKRETVIEAAQRFHAEHGREPTTGDWRKAGAWNPNQSLVFGLFGSWNQMLADAGFGERAPGRRPEQFTREQAVESLFAWKFAHERLPTMREWWLADPEHTRPSTGQVVRMFGTWNGFFVSAGYEPRAPRRSKRGYRAVMAHVTKKAAA